MRGYNLTPDEYETQELRKWQSLSAQQNQKLARLQKYKTPARIILSVLVCVSIFIILSAENRRYNNEYPISAQKLTKQSFNKADYKYRNNPEYLLRADESCDPLIINLGGQYTHFHFGYYLLNIYGDEGGMCFTVYADGSPVLDTGYLWAGTSATPSYNPLNINYEDLNVSGVSQLAFYADYNGPSDPYSTVRRAMVVDAFAYNKDWDICILDEARVLTSDQKSKLEEYAHNLRNRYGIDFMIITTSAPSGADLQSFGNNMYRQYRYYQYDDKIIIVAYFDGQTDGSSYATQLCKTSDIFSYGSKADYIKTTSIGYQGLLNYYNCMDNQEYNSAFSYILNRDYPVEVIDGSDSPTLNSKIILLIVGAIVLCMANVSISCFYSYKEAEIKDNEEKVHTSIQKYRQQYQEAEKELERTINTTHKEMDALSCYALNILPFLSVLKKDKHPKSANDIKKLITIVEKNANILNSKAAELNQRADALDNDRRIHIHYR